MPWLYSLALSGVLLLVQATGAPAPQVAAAAPDPTVLSDTLLARLPPDWRTLAATLLRMPPDDQKRLLDGTEEAQRQAIARQLARIPAAHEFLKTPLAKDPSPRVRTAIAQAFIGDARWMAVPANLALIEEAVVSDADPAVSLAALDALRAWRMRRLNALLAERVAVAAKSGDASLDRLLSEQERWISLGRGTMLPAFLRAPVPVFSAAPPDKPVRVVAFGDFGTGSAAQKALGLTLSAYHKTRPFDLGITLGDNFYSIGMESPSDPRWQTWWEDVYGSLGITFYGALGNHDWGHPDSPAAEILYSAKTTTWKMPSSYYTFTAGPVQFFALDTQSVALSERQLQWLDRELGRSTAPWKVVYGHHPIYSGGNYEDRPDLIAKLLPVLQGRADAYLCGHDHNLQALRPEGGVRFYIAGGGGAGLYDLRPYERSIFASRSNGFAVIEAEATHLTVSLVDGTGTTVYTDTLKKESPRVGPDAASVVKR